MTPFWLLVSFRLREIRRLPVALVYFGLPLILMLTSALVFGGGHPFWRRNVAVVGDAVPERVATALAPFEEVRAIACPTEPIARRRLLSGSVDAVWVPGAPDRAAPDRVVCGTRHRLLGRALAQALQARIEEVPIDAAAYLRFLFPGLVTWTILIDGLLGMGYALVYTRRNQFLKKLATTPTSPAVFVGAHILGRSILALAQIAVMTGVASLAFGLPLAASSVPAFLVVVALGLGTFMAFGFALASAITVETVFVDVVNASTVVLLLVSEVFFSVDAMPAWLGAVSAWLPSTQLVRLLRLIVLDGVTAPGLLVPGVAGLAAWAVVMLALAVRTFRWYEN